MKVLFVHLGREHLGLEHLSSVLKKAGHQTALAADVGLFGRNDNIFYNRRLERALDLSDSIVNKFAAYDPGLVCFTAYTSTLQWCFGIASRMKKIRNTPTVIGGPHVTLAPESALMCADIDFGVRGEAESLIVEFVSRIEDGRGVEDVPGVIYRSGGAVKINPLAPLVENLDSLPFPDKTLFERVVNISDDYMTLTTRGCLFNCTYCCEHAVSGLYGGAKFRRVRSVESIMEELRTMYSRYRFREVYFACPLFPPDKKWVAEFAANYRREIGKPFWCFGHVNFFDAEYAAMMKEAGCRNIEFGIQTLNEDVRRDALGRNETNEKLAEALSVCDRAGLHYDVDCIFSLPGEKEEDYAAAVSFYSRFRGVHRLKVFHLTLFPGTKIVEYAISNGLITEETRRDIMEGRTGDFFHFATIGSAIAPWKLKAYENLLRLVPIAPRGLLLFMLRPRALRLAARYPAALVKFIEMLNLIRARDLRFIFYLKLYARHLFLHAAGRRSA